jgi:hypothetical protein
LSAPTKALRVVVFSNRTEKGVEFMLKKILILSTILASFFACTPRPGHCGRHGNHPGDVAPEPDGKGVEPTGEVTEPTGKTSVFGSATAIPGALKGDIYYLPEDTDQLPDFSKLTPVGSIYTKKIDIPVQDFQNGFPGVTDRFEWFAVRYTGSFNVSAAGAYKFRLASDDGSKLFIDGKLVIDNDGVHPVEEKDGTVNLTAGGHTLVLEYFQGPATEIALQLWVTAPGAAEAIWQN